MVAKCLSVVRHQFRPAPSAADLHVKTFLRRQMRVVRFHRCDHCIYRPALERVHRGVVEKPGFEMGPMSIRLAAITQ